VQGGREVDGVLKGFDKLDNLVLDDCIEYLRGTWRFVLCLLATPFSILVLHEIRRPFIRTHESTYARTLALALAPSHPHTLSPWIHSSEKTDPTDPFKITDQTRRLGLVVCRGTHVSLISPSDGMEEIANPFEDEEEAGGGNA
jgi:small nuclear ribonucleoprotein (snRNP)-like protein